MTAHGEHLRRLAARLPGPLRRGVGRLLRPGAAWLRLPLGGLLVVGGLLGFLPLLGFWMLPLGLLLLAEDVPALRRPTVRAIERAAGGWRRLRAAWSARCAASRTRT